MEPDDDHWTVSQRVHRSFTEDLRREYHKSLERILLLQDELRDKTQDLFESERRLIVSQATYASRFSSLIRALGHQCEDHKSRISEAIRDCSLRTSCIEKKYENALIDLDAHRRNLQCRLKTAHASRNYLDNMNRRLDSRITKLDDQLGVSARTIEQLKAQNKENWDRYVDSQNQVGKTRTEVQEVESQLTKAKLQTREANDTLSTFQKQLDARLSEIQQLQRRIEEEHQRYSSLEDVVHSKESAIGNLQQQLTFVTKNAEQKEKQFLDSLGEKEAFLQLETRERRNKEHDIHVMESKLKEEERLRANFEAEFEQLKAKLSTIDAEHKDAIEKCQRTIHEQSQAIAIKDQQIATNGAALEALARDHAQQLQLQAEKFLASQSVVDSQIAEALRQSHLAGEELREGRHSMDSWRAQLQTSIESSTKTVAQLTGEKTQLLNELRQAEQTAASLREEIEKLQLALTQRCSRSRIDCEELLSNVKAANGQQQTVCEQMRQTIDELQKRIADLGSTKEMSLASMGFFSQALQTFNQRLRLRKAFYQWRERLSAARIHAMQQTETRTWVYVRWAEFAHRLLLRKRLLCQWEIIRPPPLPSSLPSSSVTPPSPPSASILDAQLENERRSSATVLGGRLLLLRLLRQWASTSSGRQQERPTPMAAPPQEAPTQAVAGSGPPQFSAENAQAMIRQMVAELASRYQMNASAQGSTRGRGGGPAPRPSSGSAHRSSSRGRGQADPSPTREPQLPGRHPSPPHLERASGEPILSLDRRPASEQATNIAVAALDAQPSTKPESPKLIQISAPSDPPRGGIPPVPQFFAESSTVSFEPPPPPASLGNTAAPLHPIPSPSAALPKDEKKPRVTLPQMDQREKESSMHTSLQCFHASPSPRQHPRPTSRGSSSEFPLPTPPPPLPPLPPPVTGVATPISHESALHSLTPTDDDLAEAPAVPADYLASADPYDKFREQVILRVQLQQLRLKLQQQQQQLDQINSNTESHPTPPPLPTVGGGITTSFLPVSHELATVSGPQLAALPDGAPPTAALAPAHPYYVGLPAPAQQLQVQHDPQLHEHHHHHPFAFPFHHPQTEAFPPVLTTLAPPYDMDQLGALGYEYFPQLSYPPGAAGPTAMPTHLQYIATQLSNAGGQFTQAHHLPIGADVYTTTLSRLQALSHQASQSQQDPSSSMDPTHPTSQQQ